MERVGMKRVRSEESGPDYALQQKMFVSEKIVNANNVIKMKEIQNHTVKLLFEAARVKSKSRESKGEESPAQPLWQQITLAGNGCIQFCGSSDAPDLLLKRRETKCCQRNNYVTADCSNCTLPLCEDCGYSCQECGVFLCTSCVNLFGCGTANHPICEKCALFK